MGWILRNWELKLGALGLATVLYTGLVFSGSFTDSQIAGVTITRINQPNGAYVLTQELPTVEVSYRRSNQATSPITPETFPATVDLSKYDMQRSGQPQSLPVQVQSTAEGVTVQSFSPTQVNVILDQLDQSTVPVFVDRGEVPPGLDLGTPVLSDERVTARGPRSLVSQVVRAVAHVAVDASGVDVNDTFSLTAVDASGQPVTSVELTPDRVRIQISVSTRETTKTVPIRPNLTGTPANGYQLGTVSVDPDVVTLRGTPDVLGGVTAVPTEPIGVQDLAANRTFTAKLALPKGAALLETGLTSVSVVVGIVPIQASRTFLVGVTCIGAASGTTCLPQVGQIAMVLSGPQPALAALKPSAFTPAVSAAGLAPGSYQLTPSITLPNGISLVSFSPAQVPVVISGPSPTPGP